MVILFVTILIILAFLLLSISLAIWVGTLVNSTSLGFLIVGGFYVIIALILLAAKKALTAPLTDSFIEKMVK